MKWNENYGMSTVLFYVRHNFRMILSNTHWSNTNLFVGAAVVAVEVRTSVFVVVSSPENNEIALSGISSFTLTTKMCFQNLT